MTSVFDTRRANLRALVRQWGGPTSLSAKLGHANGSYLAQLAGPHPRKEVSEKAARAIERKLELPDGWMDRKHAAAPAQPSTATLVELVALATDIAATQGTRVSREKLAELVTLAYEHSQLTGSIDTGYLTRLINLTR